MDENLNMEEYVKLENRIWKTYQSRIVAAMRLLNRSKLLEIYSTIYTICLTLLSVFTLINGDKLINYFSVFISIIVMGVVFYGNTMNYKDRHINMRNNYLKLGDLYYKCLNERIKGNYDIELIYKEYSSILNTVENHSKNDYMTYLINNTNEKVSGSKKVYYYLRKVFLGFLNILIISIPLVFTAISFIKLL